jgi:hypothetical protein
MGSKHPVNSPRREVPVIDRRDNKITSEYFNLIQDLVTAINGEKGEAGFISTVIMNVRITVGTGSPETVVTGDPGDLFINTSGGAGTTLWVKEIGTAKIGWAGK